jgi:hypothetical protein
MIGGPIEQLTAALLIWQDEARGVYYCGCDYVPSESHCPHHGDPVEKWPSKPQGENA